MILQRITMLLSNLPLALLNNRVGKLNNIARLNTHHVVVVLAPRQLNTEWPVSKLCLVTSPADSNWVRTRYTVARPTS